MAKVLLLEDDKKLSESLQKLFKLEGFHTTAVDDLSDLDFQITTEEIFDILILDRLVKGLDSKNYITKIKKRWPKTSILVLSAINTPVERTELINLGADDYVGKPFSSSELIARIKSLSRKYGMSQSNYAIFGNTTVDYIRRTIVVGGAEEVLPAKEFLILKTLSERAGQRHLRTELLETVWGNDFQSETNVVEATIANLRKKLASIKSEIKIRNSRNSGYWLET
jgi:two-component system OmpR family response regulator